MSDPVNSVATSPGENVVKVAVFVTDGWANTIPDTLELSSSQSC